MQYQKECYTGSLERQPRKASKRPRRSSQGRAQFALCTASEKHDRTKIRTKGLLCRRYQTAQSFIDMGRQSGGLIGFDGLAVHALLPRVEVVKSFCLLIKAPSF